MWHAGYQGGMCVVVACLEITGAGVSVCLAPPHPPSLSPLAFGGVFVHVDVPIVYLLDVSLSLSACVVGRLAPFQD